MIDSDQRPDSNRRPLLKSASTDVIISKARFDLMEFSNQRPFQILRSMADLLVRIRVKAYVSEVIGRRFKRVRNVHTFEN